jgi:ligand-binding sensor domain-containing protein
MLLWVISSTALNMFTRLILFSIILLATGTPSNLLYSDSHTRWMNESEQFSPQIVQDFQISNGDQEPVDLHFEHIGIQDGLSMSSIQALTQDRIGFLWIGAGFGLNKYDGYDITILEVNPDDPNSLTGEDISSLYTDSQDNLWIGTDIGLDRMHLPR